MVKKGASYAGYGSEQETREEDRGDGGVRGSDASFGNARERDSSWRRALLGGSVGAGATGADAPDSAREPEEQMEDPLLAWERTRAQLANRDPDTVEFITEVCLPPCRRRRAMHTSNHLPTYLH
jgi:hypothetical protein